MTAITWLPQFCGQIQVLFPNVIIEPVVESSVYLRDSLLNDKLDLVIAPDAVADALWKDPAKRPDAEALAEKIRKAGKARRITLREFQLLTGACAEGCRVAMERARIDEKSTKSMTAFDIRDKISKEWGAKLLKILGWTRE